MKIDDRSIYYYWALVIIWQKKIDVDIHNYIIHRKGTRVFVWTVRRTLKIISAAGKLFHKKQLGSLGNLIWRLWFAKIFLIWKKVFFIYETKVYLIGSDEKFYIRWYKNKKKFIKSQKCMLKEVQFLGGVIFNMIVLVLLCKYKTNLSLKIT